MTSLRRGDDDLHDENGDHISEGVDRRQAGRLSRHLAQHRMLELPEELRRAAAELKFAERELKLADQHHREVKAAAIEVARAWDAKGVTQVAIAELFAINPRTLRDWFTSGAVQRRGKRGRGTSE